MRARTIGTRCLRARRVAVSSVLAVAIALPAIGLSAAGASPRAARTSTLVTELRATPSIGGAFGSSVSVWGPVAVVGAPGVNRAYVFERRPTGWLQVAILGAGSGVLDRFGQAVAVSNTTVVVGAPGRTGGGWVYVFRRGAGTWHLWTLLQGSDTRSTGGDFGAAVSVADATIAVGAPTHDHMGAVYVFHQRPMGWRQVAELRAPDPAVNGRYGASVSLATQFLLVGAPGHNDGTGAAYMYSRPIGWSLISELQGRRPGEAFGTSVSVSGETAVVGAPGPIGTGLPVIAGRAYAFTTFPGTPWHGRAVLHGGPSSLGSFFGSSVAVTGTWARGPTVSPRRIVVGAYTNLPFVSPAHVYKPSRGWSSWAPIALLTAPGLPPRSLFGAAVAVSGGTVLVSAPSPRGVGRVDVYRT